VFCHTDAVAEKDNFASTIKTLAKQRVSQKCWG
jgi:hypothetical protein